jgi:signal transduction histidine kinase
MPIALNDRTLRTLGWVSLAACVLAYALAIGLVAIDPKVSGPTDYSDMVSPFLAVIFLVSVTMGAFITRQQPRNSVGWLLHASAWPWAAAALVDAYSRITLHIAPGSLPAGEAVEVVGSELWLPGILIMGVFLPLFYPDGKLPSPRWRWLAWLCAIDCLLGMVVFTMGGGEPDEMLEPVTTNPLAVPLDPHIVDVVTALMVLVVPIGVVAAAASLVMRFRRSSGVERLQLKWLLATMALIATMYGCAMALAAFGAAGSQLSELAINFVFVGFGLIPVVVGIAITRHGLYGIDALISRALVVGALGVFITAVYVGMVVGLGALIGQRHPSVALSVLATALVAVAFQPVRERVTRGVNRLVYGQRATPYEVLSDFASKMTGTYTTAELLPRISQTVSECLGGAHVRVWLVTGQLLEQQAAWPASSPAASTAGPVVMTAPDDLSGVLGDRVVPVRHRDELLGAIAVTKSGAEPVTRTEDEMLDHVASQAGLVLLNCRLVDDLQDSRERLVTSQDAQRRRLERDLHDGAQQSLVAIALMLRMATNQSDPRALSRSAVDAAEALQSAIAELRELARGLHPAILTDRGLGPAISSLAERSPVPVLLDVSLARRLPGQVEGALYFVVAESLTNVAKYAHATQVTLTLADRDDHVTLQIADDGVGGADASRGSGLLGLTDRVAVVEGTFTVHSPPGGGTTIRCDVPVPTVVPEQRLAGSAMSTPAGGAR